MRKIILLLLIAISSVLFAERIEKKTYIGSGFYNVTKKVYVSPHWQQRPAGLVAYWHYEDGFNPNSPVSWTDQINGYVLSFPYEAGKPTLGEQGIKLNPYSPYHHTSWMEFNAKTSNIPKQNAATFSMFIRYRFLNIGYGGHIPCFTFSADGTEGIWIHGFDNVFHSGKPSVGWLDGKFKSGGTITGSGTIESIVITKSAANGVRIYQNSNLISTGSSFSYSADNSWFRIGIERATNWSYSKDWPGEIVELGYYSKELTDEEIAEVSVPLP